MMESAEVAQLVERNLAKVEVAGSNPVFRSKPVLAGPEPAGAGYGDVAEWLGTALQKLLHRFDSGRRLACWQSGRLAQGKSASLTRKRSQVQIL